MLNLGKVYCSLLKGNLIPKINKRRPLTILQDFNASFEMFQILLAIVIRMQCFYWLFIKRPTSGTSRDNEWERVAQRVKTNENWQMWRNEWQRVKTSDSEWQRRVRNEWQQSKTNEKKYKKMILGLKWNKRLNWFLKGDVMYNCYILQQYKLFINWKIDEIIFVVKFTVCIIKIFLHIFRYQFCWKY